MVEGVDVLRRDGTQTRAEWRRSARASLLQRSTCPPWEETKHLLIALLIVGFAWRSDGALALDEGPATGTATPTATPIAGFSYCQSPGVAIPDFDPVGVNDSIEIGDDFSIADLDVYLRITHPLVGDLIATLTHVDSGTTVTLLDRPGDPAQRFGCKRPGIDVLLDDEATDPIEDECEQTIPTITGTLSPNEPLSHFDSQSIQGTWTLNVADVEFVDEGTLDEWCLVYRPGFPDTPTVTATIAPPQTETATPGPTEISTAHTATPIVSQTPTVPQTPNASQTQTPTMPQTPRTSPQTPTITPQTPSASQTPTTPQTPTLGGVSTPTPTGTHTGSFPTSTPTADGTPSPTPVTEGSPTPIGIPCTGDCNLDREVTVDELVITTRIALGQLPMALCPAADADHDGSLTIDEPVTAVGHSLHGCPDSAVSR